VFINLHRWYRLTEVPLASAVHLLRGVRSCRQKRISFGSLDARNASSFLWNIRPFLFISVAAVVLFLE
ncbi:hypothetical protein E2562_022529, partial [Oryza meyeriana var. granulata]